jgi:hypothetical protein
MKNKVIKITKKLNPKDSLDFDYVGDIYDKNDGAIELKNIKIVSKQLILKSSTFKVAGKRKKSKKRTQKKSKRKNTKKRTQKKSKKRTQKKTRRRMRGGSGGLDNTVERFNISMPPTAETLSEDPRGEKLDIDRFNEYPQGEPLDIHRFYVELQNVYVHPKYRNPPAHVVKLRFYFPRVDEVAEPAAAEKKDYGIKDVEIMIHYRDIKSLDASIKTLFETLLPPWANFRGAVGMGPHGMSKSTLTPEKKLRGGGIFSRSKKFSKLMEERLKKFESNQERDNFTTRPEDQPHRTQEEVVLNAAQEWNNDMDDSYRSHRRAGWNQGAENPKEYNSFRFFDSLINSIIGPQNERDSVNPEVLVKRKNSLKVFYDRARELDILFRKYFPHFAKNKGSKIVENMLNFELRDITAHAVGIVSGGWDPNPSADEALLLTGCIMESFCFYLHGIEVASDETLKRKNSDDLNLNSYIMNNLQAKFNKASEVSSGVRKIILEGKRTFMGISRGPSVFISINITEVTQPVEMPQPNKDYMIEIQRMLTEGREAKRKEKEIDDDVIYKAEFLGAIETQDVKYMEEMLGRGEVLIDDIIDEEGDTPLTFAILRNKPESVKKLLYEGASPNKKDTNGNTPLILAAYYGRIDLVELLLKGGADKTIENNDGRTALDYATKSEITNLLNEGVAATGPGDDEDDPTTDVSAAPQGQQKQQRQGLSDGGEPKLLASVPEVGGGEKTRRAGSTREV